MCCMRNKTKAAVTINRLREKQEEWEEGGGESGDFWGLHGSQGGNGDERRRDSPPLFLQATNND